MKDEFLPEEEGRSAEYADKILKRTFPNLRKLKTEELGKTLEKAYGVIYAHALGKISAKTATRRLLELV